MKVDSKTTLKADVAIGVDIMVYIGIVSIQSSSKMFESNMLLFRYETVMLLDCSLSMTTR